MSNCWSSDEISESPTLVAYVGLGLVGDNGESDGGNPLSGLGLGVAYMVDRFVQTELEPDCDDELDDERLLPMPGMSR